MYVYVNVNIYVYVNVYVMCVCYVYMYKYMCVSATNDGWCVVDVLRFHFYLSFKITTRNSCKAGTLTTLKLLQMKFYAHSGVTFPL